MEDVGRRFGAPDFAKRTFFRAVVDGRYKLVRWFSPEEYGNPSTAAELREKSDLGLYDLQADLGERENLAHRDHPRHDPAVVERVAMKLNALVAHEIGEDAAPFDLDLFGTRYVKARKG